MCINFLGYGCHVGILIGLASQHLSAFTDQESGNSLFPRSVTCDKAHNSFEWYRCKTRWALHAEERPNTAKSRTLKSGLGVSESGDRRAGRLRRINTCTAKQILNGTKQKKDGETNQYRCVMCPVKAMLEQFLTLPEVEAPGPKRAESGRDDR